MKADTGVFLNPCLTRGEGEGELFNLHLNLRDAPCGLGSKSGTLKQNAKVPPRLLTGASAVNIIINRVQRVQSTSKNPHFNEP